MVQSYWREKKSNHWMASKVLESQCRLPKERRDHIIKFMDELRTKDFIKPLSELPDDWQRYISDQEIKHYYPWRAVANPGSISTPHRVVVDPSMSGMNSILPKGQNNLNYLLEILIDFRCQVVAYGYDISKMYNSLHMKLESIPYQLFMWKVDLEWTSPEQEWAFIVAIYGTLSSGNQATAAIRMAAIELKDEFPLGYRAIVFKTYVGDGIGGADTIFKFFHDLSHFCH